MTETRFLAVDVLKAVAAVLIINSHLEGFYPWPFMAADGMLGNTLFFFTTGMTLAGSIARRPQEPAHVFFGRRLARMYPPLWIVVFCLLPWWQNDRSLLLSWGRELAYPTAYTFVAMSVPLYLPFFVANKAGWLRSRLKWIGLACVMGGFCLALRREWGSAPGIAWSELGVWAWSLHCFGAMLLGAWAARKAEGESCGRRVVVGIFAGVVVVYLGLRVLALPGSCRYFGPPAEAVAQLSMPACVLVCVTACRMLSWQAGTAWLREGVVGNVVAFLSAHSWETYLVHMGLAGGVMAMSITFPFNVVVVFLLTIMVAPLLKVVTVVCLRPFAHLSVFR